MKCLDGISDVKVYNLTANKAVPEWLNGKKKKSKQKRNDEDLLQDFEMPDVSSCIGLSPDGRYLMVCGTYKPVVKCYELSELSVKFERGMDAEVITFEILSDDFSKVAFLQDYRYIEIHGQGGRMHRCRIPRFGRDLAIHYPSADLYIAASGHEIYRLNLFQGRFLNSLDAETMGVNKLLFNKHHGLLLCGTDDGLLKCWDPRTRAKVGVLDCGKHMMEHAANSFEEELKSRKDLRITALECNGHFTLAVGNQTGQILMYDLRCNSPYLVRDHYMRAPINALHFHYSGNVFSMSPKVLKIWDKNTGEAVTSIEGEAPFNDMAVVPETGLAFLAAEDKRMKAYFVPSLGPAPSWCGHLDAMTEEMEEDEGASVANQFDDYTFVTMDDLVELGLTDLIGSGMLRAVMHGYYISTTMYNKAKQLSGPVKPQKVVEQKLKETIAQQNTMKLRESKKDLLEEAGTEEMKELLDERMALYFKSNKFKKITKSLKRSEPKNERKSEAYKRRQAEIAKEEEEFHQTKVRDAEAEPVESDADSVIDGAVSDDTSDEADSEDEQQREEQRRKLFRNRKGGGRRTR
uniref:Nucleolar protein 10-like n=1 Tax=Hirondellea gigas TaxID=1518452 RepID=A0A2P2I8Z2_9CRUS